MANGIKLDGHSAVITGAAGHLGRALSEQFLDLGADVVMVDLHLEALDCIREQLAAQYPARRVERIEADLSDTASGQRIAGQLREMELSPSVLVNNAAYVGASKLEGWSVPFEDQKAEAWVQALGVNLTGPFFLTQALFPALRQSGCGSVVNIGSIYGVVGPDWSLYEGTEIGNPAGYAVSKGGLMQATRWLATTLAPSVRVNAVCPGGILRGQPEKFVERYCKKVPLGRMASEKDVTGVVSFLCSDAAAYITGQVIMVDGGWSVW